MSKIRLCLIVPLAIIVVGCSLSSNTTNVQISDVGYSISNVPADWWVSSSSQTPSLVYKFTLQFSGELSSGDINSARIYIGDTSRYWSFYSSDFDASLNRLSANNFWWTANDNELPIGQFTARVELVNGKVLEKTFLVGIPGHIEPSSYSYVYNSDEENQADNISSSAKTLQKVTINSAIKTNSEITINFKIHGDNVHNGWVWFFDTNENYLGYSGLFLDADTGAIKAGLNSGQAFNNENLEDNLLAIQQTGISDSSGSVISLADFNNIARCRVVVCDGAQYEYLGKYSYYDYRAISVLTNIQ